MLLARSQRAARLLGSALLPLCRLPQPDASLGKGAPMAQLCYCTNAGIQGKQASEQSAAWHGADHGPEPQALGRLCAAPVAVSAGASCRASCLPLLVTRSSVQAMCMIMSAECSNPIQACLQHHHAALRRDGRDPEGYRLRVHDPAVNMFWKNVEARAVDERLPMLGRAPITWNLPPESVAGAP